MGEENCLRRSFLRTSLARHLGDHAEAGVSQVSGDDLRREEMGVHRHIVSVGVCEMPVALADLDAEQGVAPGRQNAEKLGKYPGEIRRRRMDYRVPGEDSAQLPVCEGEVRQRCDRSRTTVRYGYAELRPGTVAW